jgi:hypothetical protein
MEIENKILQHKKRAFLEAYAYTGNITKAAEIADMPRQNHYDWMKFDPDYPAAFKNADEAASERLETEARRRAVEGTSKPVFYQGAVCGAIQEYSDNLLMFLLKGSKPQKYRENVTMDVGNKDNKPFDIRTTPTEELIQAEAEKIAKMFGISVDKAIEKLKREYEGI